MNTITYQQNGKTHQRTAPQAWNEVTADQMVLWVSVLHADVSEEVKLAMAMPIFYGIDSKTFRQIPPHMRMQIAPTLRNLIKENKLSTWLIPSFRLRFRKYYGPADMLSNLTAHEFFNICEPLYWAYKQGDGGTGTLDALCAVLYRQKRSGPVDDDLREELTDAGIAKRAKRFARLNLDFKRAILFNYEGCRNFITKHRDYSAAFDGKGGKSKRKGDVTLTLAGGPLGDHPQTKRTNLYTFLLHLVNLIEQEQEFKSKNR